MSATTFPGEPAVELPGQLIIGEQLAAEAIERVERNADADWIEAAYMAVVRIAAVRAAFTTDQVWAEVGSPREPRAMGAVMRRANREGICKPTDRTRASARPENHARPVRVWESLRCR